MSEEVAPKKSLLLPLRNLYERQYRKLLIIPLLVILASVVIIAGHYSATGEFFKKDVSLQGGVTVTVTKPASLALPDLERQLRSVTGIADVTVRSLSRGGSAQGFIVDAGVSEPAAVDGLVAALEPHVPKLAADDYTVQVIGSSLGASFLRQAMTALLIAFAFMAVVVFAYFRVIVPSLFVIWTAFADMLCTFAAMVLLDVHLSTAGLAAFLMLVGYSVDTDILLTSRVLKSREGTVSERTMGAMRTGMTMTLTAFVAVTAGLFLANSDTIRQIMLVLFVGLAFDVIHTWLTNASILRWWVERQQR
jgi:preprotein translocase subunit SecF